MKVLVLESDPGAGRRVAALFQAAGHHVVRCHEAGLPAFPCNGLLDRCPFDADVDAVDAVDVAVLVRAHVRPSPTPTERGASCAIRRGVPLVATGRTVLNPFEPWLAADVSEDELIAVCEHLVAARSHLAVAT